MALLYHIIPVNKRGRKEESRKSALSKYHSNHFCRPDLLMDVKVSVNLRRNGICIISKYLSPNIY